MGKRPDTRAGEKPASPDPRELEWRMLAWARLMARGHADGWMLDGVVLCVCGSMMWSCGTTTPNHTDHIVALHAQHSCVLLLEYGTEDEDEKQWLEDGSRVLEPNYK
eukprot:scaffold23175_cov115-Isochrysis_galbana.AAC.12